MENRYGNFLSIILIIAIIVVVGVLGFFGYKVYDNSQTAKKAEENVSDFDENTGNSEENTNNSNNEEDNNNTSNEGGSSLDDILNNMGGEGTTNSMYDKPSGNSNEIKDEDGDRIIGTISIPSINIELPIYEEYYSETIEKGAAAVHPRDTAGAVNQPGNLVLWSHNKKQSGVLFSDLAKLTTKDKIYIKDLSGTKIEYQVYNSYETTDSDMSYATRNTDGAREITLSTCTEQGGKRHIIWARET